MTPLSLLPFITILYLVLLFFIAYIGDKMKEKGKSLAKNPYIYSLSLAVYCTAWTFYGSVGLFAHNGFEYIPIYIGATFAAFTYNYTLKKIISISKNHNTTSIADFISTRYGKSSMLAGFVSLLLVLGLLPYIALQLKAITNTLNLLYFYEQDKFTSDIKLFYQDYAFYIAIILSIFGALFGARKLDVTERHEGMVLAIAFEALIKLIAFLCVGIYVTYFIFKGYQDILEQGAIFHEIKMLYRIGDAPTPSYFQWLNLILLSGVAVMLLPRQFHIGIIENTSEKHVKKAMFLFPLYLFLINFFVPAIAIGGRLVGLSSSEADIYVLKIPLLKGNQFLSILAFVGGFSAATGMLIVETVALSTMVINHVISPYIVKAKLKWDLSFLLIHLKRATILMIMLLGYAYFKIIGETKILVDIGLMSFCAVLQLAPATFLGIFWEKTNKIGAFAGIVSGFSVWFYTLLMPSLAEALPPLKEIVDNGLFGFYFLKPSALFYLEGLDLWSHSIFWSLFLNLFFTISFSIIFAQSKTEQETAKSFVYLGEKRGKEYAPEPVEHISKPPSFQEYIDFLSKFIGKEAAKKALISYFEATGIKTDAILTSQQSILLRNYVEKTLAAYLGTATSKNILDSFLKVHGTKIVEIFEIFQDVSETLKESRENLAIRLNELSLLYKSLQELLSTIDEDKVLDIGLNIIQKNFNATGCAIVLMDNDNKLRIKRQSGLAEELVNHIVFESTKTSYVGRAFEEKSIVAVEDIEQAPFPPKILKFKDNSPVLSLAVAPIIVTGTPMGVIFLLNNTKHYFSEHFLNFFQGIANQIGLSLRNSQLYAELNKLNKELENKVAERTIELKNKSQLLEEAYNNLKEVDRLKTQFLSTISHELRTPLNSIIGYTQLMLDGVEGELMEGQKEDLERIEKNAKHLLQLINDILDLSKIEAGKMQLNIEKVDLEDIINQVLTIVLPLKGKKNIEMIDNVKEKKIFLLADKQRIEQIFINLLSNAIKFTDEGFITIDCTTKIDATGTRWAEISVKDTGIGIAKENLEKIFEAFKQVEDASTRKHSGTGLGLSITKKLVEMHGGSIWAESEIGKGTIVAFTMPIASESEYFKPYMKEINITKDFDKKTVFIIEEDENILQNLYDKLTQADFNVEYVNSSNMFLEAKKAQPMVILINPKTYENDKELLDNISQDPFTSKSVIFVLNNEFLNSDIVAQINKVIKSKGGEHG